VLWLKRFLLACFCVFFSSIVLATTITLYEQPKVDAKAVGTVDSNNGIILIFTPKDSQWIKVADPKNGNVGWIKQSDLATGTKNNNASVSVTQRFVSTGSTPQTFQIIYNGPQSFTHTESVTLKQMEEYQRAALKAAEKMTQEMLRNLNRDFAPAFPMVMPMVLVPVPAAPANAPGTPQQQGK